MNETPMNNPLSNNPANTTMNQTDQILEALRPRMHAARVAHFRRLAAGVVAIPLLGFGAAATAADGGGSSTEIEAAIATEDGDERDLPEIGDAEKAESDETTPDKDADDESDEKAERDENDESDGNDGKDDSDVETTPADVTTTLPDPDAPKDLDLGALGWIQVEPSADAFEVLSYDLTEDWEVLNAEVVDGTLNILLGDGEVLKVVVITPGVRDEILVAVEDFVIPTTTVKPEPKEEHDDEPAPVGDRFIVEVAGKGSFVVERDGETLYVGNVTANPGHDHEVHKAQGWKVWVGFTDGETVFFGKALINDAGEVEQHFWQEDIGPEPVYTWVEIPEVGAVKFEVVENLIRVVKTETAEGFETWDYNQGAATGTAKVDFEGEGTIWFVEAWINESGELAYSKYQG